MRRKVLEFDLSQRRIVAFATHGLLPGDFPGVTEPALALANPGDMQALRRRARETVLQRYDVTRVLPQQLALIDGLAR